MTPAVRKAIRDAYALEMPAIMDARNRGRKRDPYILDWVLIFSPIEWKLWQDIRYYGIPMYPQFPVGYRFVDFGDPYLKIAVEADGAAYHDRATDMDRDEELRKLGWKVFHIPGKKTMVSEYPLLDMCESDPEYCDVAIEWGLMSSVGFIWALDKYYYDKRVSIAVKHAAEVILESHLLIGAFS